MSELENQKVIVKYLLLSLTLILYFLLGVLKWNYIINPGIANGDFLIYRYSHEAQLNYNGQYSDPVRYFFFTPKWFSTILYGNLFLVLNLIVIRLVYNQKRFVRFTFWLFFWVSLISVVSLGAGVLMGKYNEVYILVARIKELQQSPFTLILLLASFKLADNYS